MAQHSDNDNLPYQTYADQADEPTDKVQVQAPAGKGPETAAELLKVAADLDLDPSVIETADGHFLVPQEVADKAKLPEGDAVVDVADSSVQGSQGGDGDPAEAPAFETKVAALDFAKLHELDVDERASAADVKDAVTKAYAEKRAKLGGVTT